MLEGRDEGVHHRFGVFGSGGEAEALSAGGDGGVIDGGGVHAEFADEPHADFGGAGGVADEERDDVAGAGHDRQPGFGKFSFQGFGAVEEEGAACGVRFQGADGGECGGDGGGWQGGREDEAGGDGADIVEDFEIAGDVAAVAAIGFGEGAFDDSDAVGDAVTLGNAAAMGAVHADRVDFVEIGQRVVFIGEVADGGERGDVAVHRVDALEGDEFGSVGGGVGKAAFEVRHVVMFEDVDRGLAAVLDADDHGVVVLGVGEDVPIRQGIQDGAQRGLVGDVAGGEEEGGILAVQVRELFLEGDVEGRGAGDVAGAAGAGAVAAGGFDRGFDDHRVGAHGEVIVRGPD